MAKNEGNVFETRLREVEKDIQAREKELAALQDRLRANPYDDGLRRQVQDAKRPLAVLADERGELARSVSRLAGGKQFTPPI